MGHYERKCWQKGGSLLSQWEYDRGHYALKPFYFTKLQLTVSVQFGRDKRCSAKAGDAGLSYPVWTEQIWANAHTRLPLDSAQSVEIMIYDERHHQPLNLTAINNQFGGEFADEEFYCWKGESVGNYVPVPTARKLLDQLAQCELDRAPNAADANTRTVDLILIAFLVIVFIHIAFFT